MGKTAKAVGRVIGYILVAAAVWLTTLDGVAARLAYDQHPQAVQRYSSTSKTAVVFFTGVQSSGRTHSAPLQGLWSQHGDVVVVQYNPHRFDGRVTAFDVRAQLVEWGYQRALLIGASMGGLLATDIIDLDRATGNRLSFAAVLVDTPQSEQDLYHADRAEAVALIAHPGPAGNLFSGWIWRYFFDPPPQYMLGSGVDQSLLAEHYRGQQQLPAVGLVHASALYCAAPWVRAQPIQRHPVGGHGIRARRRRQAHCQQMAVGLWRRHGHKGAANHSRGLCGVP